MKKVLYRAWDKNNKKIVYVWDNFAKTLWEMINYFEDEDLMQYTWLKDNNWKKIYEWDIVRVFANRSPKYSSTQRSKHDKKWVEARCVIEFDRYSYRLNKKNNFNDNIIKLKWKEKDERYLSMYNSLWDYDFFQDNKWNQKENSHAIWHKIEVIWNIHKNNNLINNL